MKHLSLITLPTLFFLCTGVFAQVAPETPAPEQEVIEQTGAEEQVQEAAETNVAETNVAEIEQAVIEPSPEDVETTEAGTATVTMVEEEPIEWVNRQELVSIGSDSHLGPREKTREMVTVMGNSHAEGRVERELVTVLGSSKLTGSVGQEMVTVLGNADVNGKVDGDMAVVLGSATLGPNAEINGELVVIGGRIDRHPDSKSRGQEVVIPFLPPGMTKAFEDIPKFVSDCVLLARPISPNVKITLYIAGIFMVFYLLLAILFPRQLERSRKSIEERPFNAFLAGILVLAAYIPFSIIMVITVVGILLLPVADIALIAIAVFGKAVAFFFIGRQMARAIRASFLEHPIFSILIGGCVVYALYMIPFFGLFLWMIMSILGLGAVCLAIGESISERKAARQPAMSTLPSGATTPALSGSEAHEVSGGPVPPGTALSQVDPSEAAIFQRVGFWWRTLAIMIDLMLVGLLIGILNIGVPLLPLFAYFIIFWGWKGSTLGGMALGIRVQKISGEPMDWSTSIIRSLSSIVSFLPFFIGFFWAGWDPENQSWHDKIAGTAVVQVPKGYTWS